ncbi:MAG: molybdopterin-dependent oxidoreductase [Acidobacteria bacterium]|nr:molybdopterin-dependent oxidoreductase [Acidobacteriota bacterium]
MPEIFEIEPERYELFEAPRYIFTPTRREFLATLGVGIMVVPAIAQQRRGGGGGANVPVGSRLHIATDGTVTVLSGKVEVGQGARTELAMAAAEELRLPLEQMRVILGDTDLTPNDGLTAGSGTTPRTVPSVRSAAAAAREMLLSTAAERWHADRATLRITNGRITHDGKSFGYADLASALAGVQPNTTALTKVDDWKILGTSQYRADAHAIVTGKHEYPSDIKRPGMLYGCVLRAPAYNSKLKSADLTAAQKLPGVVAVKDGDFAGCAASTSYAARKAVAAIAAEWDTKEHPSSDVLFTHLKSHAKPGRSASERGSISTGLAAAAKKHTATYQVPFIAHAPMEPRAAVAEWVDGKLTVWTGTQNPFGVRDQLMQAFHLTADKVRVIQPDSGGGFGGKHISDAALEAARLAKEAGKPVCVRWTRAEEFMWAYFRPAGLFEIEAGLDAEGRLTAWKFVNYNAGGAALETPYKVANAHHHFLGSQSPLREGSYRGIAATANNFARECFMDELASAANLDPLEFRLRNADNDRLRAVLQAAAKKFRFAERRAAKKGIGIAGGTEKGSYVAACVELDPTTGKIREFCMAFECGKILNPANLRAQVEGSIIQGLGGALTEAIEFAGGKLKNGSFARYKVPRFKDVPTLDVVLLDRPDLAPAGAGETPIIAVAPAIANAAFHAYGERRRAMPVKMGRA